MRIISALTLVATAISMSFAAQANLLQYRLYHIYYSNEQKIEVVGYSIIYCDDTVAGNGYPTPWYDEYWTDCDQ
ncbi:MAG: hypothetical protein ACT4N8_10345 [Sphingosinicella sp.]|uniref:hypothetical protein n=1 Tax=Sphingosinicella sp. TaxID=1917971 RepID=UPI0040381569